MILYILHYNLDNSGLVTELAFVYTYIHNISVSISIYIYIYIHTYIYIYICIHMCVTFIMLYKGMQ